MKTLIVDDSLTMRRIIKNTLKKIGFKEDTLIEAKDGTDAWELLQNNSDINLILTDWNMPNMNGLELVKKIRAEKKYKKIPIIMITTEGGKKEVITALRAGVNNYIVKPFTPNILRSKLESILN